MVVHDPYIQISTDRKKTRLLPVKHITQGLPADGYTIEKVLIKPNTVTVEGLKYRQTYSSLPRQLISPDCNQAKLSSLSYL